MNCCCYLDTKCSTININIDQIFIAQLRKLSKNLTFPVRIGIIEDPTRGTKPVSGSLVVNDREFERREAEFKIGSVDHHCLSILSLFLLQTVNYDLEHDNDYFAIRHDDALTLSVPQNKSIVLDLDDTLTEQILFSCYKYSLMLFVG